MADPSDLLHTVEGLIRRQAQFEKELAGRMLAPAHAVLDLVEQSAAAMRAQSTALEAAATSFHQAAEMIALQATLMERAVQSLRDPLSVVRAAAPDPRRRKGGAGDQE